MICFPVDGIYATFVVPLHRTEPFHQDQLWRYAAGFRTNTAKQLGVKLARRAPSVGELEVYFGPAVATSRFDQGKAAFAAASRAHKIPSKSVALPARSRTATPARSPSPDAAVREEQEDAPLSATA